jgi:lipopolysaccharide-induced tumor necrosis factor-alpha factor
MPYVEKKKLSTGGWVLFVVLLLVCFPICWLPFVIDGCKEEVRKCPACFTRLG